MLLTGALIGTTWLGLFVAGHLAALFWGPRPLRSSTALWLLLAALAGSIVSAALLPLEAAPWATPVSHRSVAVSGAIVTLACGFILWMPAYYVVVSSISGQLLVRLEAAPGGSLPHESLTATETSRQLVSPRLASMVQAGLLIQEDGRYRVTAKGRRTARLFCALRSLWRLKSPG